MTPHWQHSGLVAFAAVAGMSMVGVGVLRLLLPVQRGAPHSRLRLCMTYGPMVLLGALLTALALLFHPHH